MKFSVHSCSTHQTASFAGLSCSESWSQPQLFPELPTLALMLSQLPALLVPPVPCVSSAWPSAINCTCLQALSYFPQKALIPRKLLKTKTHGFWAQPVLGQLSPSTLSKRICFKTPKF